MSMIERYEIHGQRMYPALDRWLEPDVETFEFEREEVRVINERRRPVYVADMLCSEGESLDHYRARMRRERNGGQA